ncbi:MAG: DUF420 domain-containing protein [Deltaproteobacteria bacterium]|nr:DUF420 domain-containing protein [Deltaproteobacteria bacterium]MBW2444436.1 DUF420 domain-containing protein [Deltaproteobacteria bacterium]
MDLSSLPAVNASLNGLATVLLILGRHLVRQGRVEAHRRVMLSAFGVSSLFLVFYVTHKIWRGFEHTAYHGVGAARTAYLAILGTHLVLAMTVPFLALALIRLGLSDRRAEHRRLARVAWPVWLYVSVTGIVIYGMLYHWNPVPI